MKRTKLMAKLAIVASLIAAQMWFIAPTAGAVSYLERCANRDTVQMIHEQNSPEVEWMYDTRTEDWVPAKVTVNGTFFKIESMNRKQPLAISEWCIQTDAGAQYGTGRSAYANAMNDQGYRELIRTVKIYTVTTEG